MTVKRIYTETLEVEITNEQAFEREFWPELQAGLTKEQILKIIALKYSTVRPQISSCISVEVTNKVETTE